MLWLNKCSKELCKHWKNCTNTASLVLVGCGFFPSKAGIRHMLQTTKKPLLVHLSSEHISQTKAESVWPFKCKPMIFLFDLASVRTRIQLLLVFIYPGILHFVSWLQRGVPKALRATHRTGQGQGLGAVAAPQCH